MRKGQPITSEIFQVDGDSLSAPEDAAVYLIDYKRSCRGGRFRMFMARWMLPCIQTV